MLSAFSLECHLCAYLSVGPTYQSLFKAVFVIQPSLMISRPVP